MKKYIIITSIAFSIIFTNCDNNSKVNKSNKEIDQESFIVENQKEMHQKSIDSLNQEIEKLNNAKTKLSSQKEFASAEIFGIIKESYFDHIVIGSQDLVKSNTFFTDSLGFKIKIGHINKNGISNLFIEFPDSSELEIMSIESPTNKLSNEYFERLKEEDFAFQFALRTNQINNLKEQFDKSRNIFLNFNTIQDYSTLSNDNFEKQLPFFFIQYHKDNYASTVHENSAIGISSVWLEVKELKESVLAYTDFGFKAVNTIAVGDYSGKTILMTNDNFEIIFIESNQERIAGITIIVEDILKFKENVSKKLTNEFKIKQTIRGKSISLNPKITNSIWFEFIEN